MDEVEVVINLVSLGAAGVLFAFFLYRKFAESQAKDAYAELGLRSVGKNAIGIFEGHRVSVRRVEGDGADAALTAWICVHIDHALQVGRPDLRKVLPREAQGAAHLHGSPRLAHLEQNLPSDVKGLVILDHAVCRRLDSLHGSATTLRAPLSALVHATQKIRAARDRAASAEDQADQEALRAALGELDLQVTAAPPRALGAHRGFEVEAYVEPGDETLPGACIAHVKLAHAHRFHAALFEPVSSATLDYLVCPVSHVARFSLCLWDGMEPPWFRQRLVPALEAYGDSLVALRIEDQLLTVGLRDASPSALPEAVQIATDIAQKISSYVSAPTPYRG